MQGVFFPELWTEVVAGLLIIAVLFLLFPRLGEVVLTGESDFSVVPRPDIYAARLILTCLALRSFERLFEELWFKSCGASGCFMLLLRAGLFRRTLFAVASLFIFCGIRDSPYVVCFCKFRSELLYGCENMFQTSLELTLVCNWKK